MDPTGSPASAPPHVSVRGSSATLWRVIAGALFVVAAGLVLFLTASAWIYGDSPPGCGGGTGCADVLSGRWSRVVGVPVGVPALMIYAAALVGLFQKRCAWLVVAASGALLASAAWFVGLQVFVIKAYCLYCMAVHAFGVVGAVVSMAACLPGVTRRNAVWLGVAAVALLATVQTLQPDRAYQIEMGVGLDGDAVVRGKRVVTVLNGALMLTVEDEPLLGNPRAKRVMVVMVDYACPHCQKLHDMLKGLVARRPGEVAVVTVPVALWHECNPKVPVGGWSERFRGSCELAKLALAVHSVAPGEAFAKFESWMFDSETPRTPGEARLEAAERFGVEPVRIALADARVVAKLARNIEAYGRAGTSKLPILVTPGKRALISPAQNPSAIEALLDEH